MVTGKTFGITNIIALDADRNVIQDQRVLVKRDEGKVVNLVRGTDRQSYNCTPQCNPSITIGDEQKYFDAIRNASQNKIELLRRHGRQGPAGPVGAARDRRQRPSARRRQLPTKFTKYARRLAGDLRLVQQSARILRPLR